MVIMAYRHEAFQFPMEHSAPGNMFFHHPTPHFQPFMPQQAPEMIYQQYAFPEYLEFMHPGMVMEDFEDSAEISTRPRLTKEQVEILESQFQAHPKPNSMVKKQLAMQTKLTLPRVANWFQNRRAKAKQQRKQEEYENQQNSDGRSDSQHELSGLSDGAETNPEGSIRGLPSPVKQSTPQDVTQSSESRPQSPARSESIREASWQSLQRALNAAKAAQRRRAQEQSQLAMPPPDGFPSMSIPHPESVPQPSQIPVVVPVSEWAKSERDMHGWSSSPAPDAIGFDFGFDQESDLTGDETVGHVNHSYVVTSSEWPASYFADVPAQQQANYSGIVSPPLPLPTYPCSRRGSGAEDLANNLGTFGLDNTPIATAVGQIGSPLQASIDLASRRKRPRPAALTSASLRSRSYGAMSSTSPVFRNGPPSGGQLRQVKSTSHGLNSHYAGVRKQSIPQKSPLNIATFAEADAEALNALLAHQAAEKTPTPADHLAAVDGTENEHPGIVDISQLQQAPADMISQYKAVQSPPVTPFQTEFVLQSTMSMQPPASSAQYATFADFTPPYSAGPLTNSTCSWSDAPLRSPDLPSFPNGGFMSPSGFSHQDPAFQQWVLPSDNLVDPAARKKTEFFYTEFPGQKEELASVAQQVQIQKPKNYVFANTAPSDYDT